MNDNIHCPLCGHRNPLTNRFCGHCGASLTVGEQLVPRREDSLAAERSLPAKLKPVGKALAVGAAVLVAEAALAWLHRRGGLRIEAVQLPPLPSAQSGTLPAAPDHLIGQSLEEVFVHMQGNNSSSELFVQRAVRMLLVPDSPEGPR